MLVEEAEGGEGPIASLSQIRVAVGTVVVLATIGGAVRLVALVLLVMTRSRVF